MTPAPLLAYDPDAAVPLGQLTDHYGVHLFRSLRDALGGFSHINPDLVLAWLDEGGLELCEHVTSRDPLLPVLFVASSPSPHFVAAAMRAGARDLLLLDEPDLDVIARIRRATGWRQQVERDTEAQIQSFMIQAELFQRQAQNLQAEVDALHLRLQAEKALVSQVQRQLERQREIARAAARAKSVFLANMTHELHTPLNAIIGYAEMLREDLPDEQANDALKIIESGKRLLRLLQDVFDLARLEAGDVHPAFQTVLLDAIIERSTHDLRELVPDAPPIVLELDPACSKLTTDPDRLADALGQLLHNAASFGKGAPITVRTRPHEGGVAIDVIDRGVGFDPAELEKMLQAFDQLDGQGTGAGMGLAVADHLVQVLGGHLEAQGAKGEGATFTIWLPKPEGAREHGSPEAPPVLVIDDDPTHLQLLASMLVAEGFRAITTGDPREVPSLIAAHSPVLVVMDVFLPGDRDGYALTETLRAADRSLPVALVSVDIDPARARAAGACAALHKPITQETLQDLLHTHALPARTEVVVVEGAPSSAALCERLQVPGITANAVPVARIEALPSTVDAILLPVDLPLGTALAALAIPPHQARSFIACGSPRDPLERDLLLSRFDALLPLDAELPHALREHLQTR